MKLFLVSILLLVTKGLFCQRNKETIVITNDLKLIRISQNAYIHVSYTNLPQYGRISANGLVFAHKSDGFLFDTPWNDSLTKILVDYLKDNMGINIKAFLPNHWHSDCMGGMGYLQSKGIESYACQRTIEIARIHGLPVPTHGFNNSLQLTLGNKVIECFFPGVAHSQDNIVVWIPSERILFPGCIVKDINETDLGYTSDGDVKSYPATMSSIIRKYKNAKIVIPGHGDSGGINLLLHTRDLAAIINCKEQGKGHKKNEPPGKVKD